MESFKIKRCFENSIHTVRNLHAKLLLIYNYYEENKKKEQSDSNRQKKAFNPRATRKWNRHHASSFGAARDREVHRLEGLGCGVSRAPLSEANNSTEQHSSGPWRRRADVGNGVTPTQDEVAGWEGDEPRGAFEGFGISLWMEILFRSIC